MLFRIHSNWDRKCDWVRGFEKDDATEDRIEATSGRWLEPSYLDNFQFEWVESKKRSSGFMPNSLNWLIVSEVLKCTFESMPISDQFQFLQLPPKLNSRAGEIYLLNVLKLHSCLDVEHSDIQLDADDEGKLYIGALRKAVLKKAQIDPSLSIFRLSEYRGFVVVSEVVLQKLLRDKVPGFEYIQLECR